MAGDWIKIETALPTKIEILQLTELLDCSRAEALGYCVVFWCWCDANMSPDCHRVTVTKKTLDGVVGVTGFAQSMVSVGWLVDLADAVEVPNFDRHLSKSAKTRARNAKNQSAARRDASPLRGDKTVTREEKRRRECELANSPSANADPGVLTEQDARQVCDAIAETFGIPCKLTKARRAKLRTRWRDPTFRTDWLAAIHAAGGQPFFRGDNDRGWKFSFDFFVKPDSVTNILEGKYDNAKQSTSTAQRRENANAAAFSALRFEDDPDVAETPERVTGDSGDAGAIVFNEESGAVHTARRGNLGGDSFELPY